jgi:hypothetical protein
MENSSTILIRNTTRERLKRIGSKAQTYDELINQLLDLQKQNLWSREFLTNSKIFESDGYEPNGF